MKRKHLSARELIFDRDNYICYICNKKFTKIDLQIDHLFPVAKGGTNTLNNLFTICRPCNQKKRDKLDLTLALECLMEDPDDGALYINCEKLNKLPFQYSAAVIDLWIKKKISIPISRPPDHEIVAEIGKP